MQTSLQTTVNATGKFWTHAEVEHAQGPDFTSMYPDNTERWGEGKTYFGVLTQTLLGEMSC